MQRIVLITGATSGIGAACARRFARGGDRLLLTGRHTERLAAITRELKGQGAVVLPLVFDVRDREAAARALQGLPPEWQAIDVLVNNAGLALGLEAEHEGDYADSDTMIDTNIKGLLTMTRLIVPGMVARGRGHVINIGSMAGEAAYAGGAVYCATKGAVKLLTEGLRIDLVATPLRVTNVKPGLVDTGFSTVRFHGDAARAEKVYEGLVPLRAEDVADVVRYAADAPPHVQIAEVLVLPTCQASATVIAR